jgi:hypothetical protein
MVAILVLGVGTTAHAQQILAGGPVSLTNVELR